MVGYNARVRALHPSGIRAALPADSPTLQHLAAQAFAEYDAKAARTVLRMMSSPGARTIVAERRGSLVGFVVVER
ncbi:MAG: hypothetical protein K0R38_972 [Polyangiaceae bacterium]|jgi:hypothetical protein|nr:hypothetical protein [Polyangiaceae bacterium]